jgi:hypothetical protein
MAFSTALASCKGAPAAAKAPAAAAGMAVGVLFEEKAGWLPICVRHDPQDAGCQEASAEERGQQTVCGVRSATGPHTTVHLRVTQMRSPCPDM